MSVEWMVKGIQRRVDDLAKVLEGQDKIHRKAMYAAAERERTLIREVEDLRCQLLRSELKRLKESAHAKSNNEEE
jgi:hypothetical protein